MKHPTRGCRPRPRVRGPLKLLLIAGPVIAFALWSGCSVTQKNHKVLSFFFDGVPEPSVSPAAAAAGAGPSRVILHRPYAEERCDACHRSKYRPSKTDSSICLECHAAVQTQHERMHGAVIAAACLWCHNPHESSHPALLRSADRKVCGQCHTEEMLRASRIPEHTDASRACLECHSGHGSSRPFLLKPGVAESPPEQTPIDPAPAGAVGGAGG